MCPLFCLSVYHAFPATSVSIGRTSLSSQLIFFAFPISIPTFLGKNTRSIETSRVPKATPRLARSSQTGSTTLGPSIPIYSMMPPPVSLFMPPSSIHHICPHPASITLQQRQLSQRKEKAEKDEKNTAATMQNSAGQSSSLCSGTCSPLPGLSCKHTLFSRGTTALGPGGWNWGVVLSKAV